MAYRDDWRYPSGLMIHSGPKVFASAIHINQFDPQSWKVETFSQDVVGFLSSETTAIIMLDDEEIKTGISYNDYYGLLTCLPQHLETQPKKPLYKVLRTNVHLEFYYKIPIEEMGSGRQAYLDLPKSWYEIGHNSLTDLEHYFSLTPNERMSYEFKSESLYVGQEVARLDTRVDAMSAVGYHEVEKLINDLEERFPDGDWDGVRIKALEELKSQCILNQIT